MVDCLRFAQSKKNSRRTIILRTEFAASAKSKDCAWRANAMGVLSLGDRKISEKGRYLSSHNNNTRRTSVVEYQCGVCITRGAYSNRINYYGTAGRGKGDQRVWPIFAHRANNKRIIYEYLFINTRTCVCGKKK